MVAVGYLSVTILGNIGGSMGTTSMVLQAVICLATPFALIWPRAIGWLMVAAGATSYFTSDKHIGLAQLGMWFTAAVIQAHGRRITALAVAAGLGIPSALIVYHQDSPMNGWPGVITELFVLLLALSIGELIWRLRRTNSRTARLLRERAADERREIARVLHDTVAYATTTMVMRADAIRLRGEHDEETTADLAYIAEAGRQCTDDLRRMLILLRKNHSLPDSLPLEPLASLQETIAEQTQKLRLNGFEVHTEAQGLDTLPTPASRALARVLVEAASNVTKHGDQNHPVQVMIEATDTTAELLVTNQSHSRRNQPSGHVPLGLVGVREVVEALDGDLVTGRVDGTTWITHATIPIHQHERQATHG